MYLSRVKLENWRSYQDAEFNFDAPRPDKPLVLIGAMNGHGKTSFLVALYLGLFGRFGIEYCEGLTKQEGDEPESYRRTLEKFRRNEKGPFPTTIELTFRTTLELGSRTREVRILRTWHFSYEGKAKQGSSFEELQIYENEEILQITDPQSRETAEQITRLLFPDHIMPAFFFDGEQAGALIHNSGSAGIRQAVDVMFGTKVVEELTERLQQYITTSRNKIGSKKATSDTQTQLDEYLAARQKLQKELSVTENEIERLEDLKSTLTELRTQKSDALVRLGGETIPDLTKCVAEYTKADAEHTEARTRLLDSVSENLGPALATVRLAKSLLNRLESESIREEWLALKDGTLQRSDNVLERALPEPASEDPILRALTESQRIALRQRFLHALESIYNPPPTNCAESFQHAHLSSESRRALIAKVREISGFGSTHLRNLSIAVTNAEARLDGAKAMRDRCNGLPDEIEEIRRALDGLQPKIEDTHAQIHELSGKRSELRTHLKNTNLRITQLQDELSKLAPEQKRLSIAEHARQAASDLIDRLKPLAVKHIETSISEYFNAIADKRYHGSKIYLPDGSDSRPPCVELCNGDRILLETMSGFERRAFGIAFSLALADLAGVRVPLVIDTPIGNADSEYRPRTLKTLAKANLDQIIILAHDKEVSANVYNNIKNSVNQTFLVKYTAETRSSHVYANKYFEG